MDQQSERVSPLDEITLGKLTEISKERNLPVINLGTQQYVVDIANGELRNVSNPLRTIAMDAMEEEEEGYTFLYDVKEDKIVLDKGSWGDLSTKQWIDLPAIEELDPGFVKRIAHEEECQLDIIRHGASIYNDRGEWRPRDLGPILPVVNFYGTDFFFDVTQKEFSQVDNASNKIPFAALDPLDYHYTFLYDTHNKNEYKGQDEYILESPHVKSLFLPPIDIMISEGIERHQKLLDAKAKKENAIHIKVSKKRNFKR